VIAKFTSEDLQRAHDDWGCSCGPAAFAFACGLTLEEAHKHFPSFRGWTNTKMMKAALQDAKIRWAEMPYAEKPMMFNTAIASIVRVEFTGPWTGTQWACHHSHWIATFVGRERCIGDHLVYDVNNSARDGVCELKVWEDETLTELLKVHKRSTGYQPTNIIGITPREVAA
jgi:hypothetical protein